MSLFIPGRVCVKIAGRDAGLKCVVVNLEKNYALIDGQTRRKRCNIVHLEPLETVLPLEKDADHDTVEKAFNEVGITLISKKKKTTTDKPQKKKN